MKRKTVLIMAAAIVLMAVGLAAQEAHPAVKLITDVNALFEKMSQTMVSEPEGAAVLDTVMEAATELRAANRIDAAFLKRFQRILLVIRLSLITDRSGILKTLVFQEMAGFVKDVSGEKFDPEGPATAQIGMFSKAVDTELMNLYGLVRTE
ncbi:MAG: hypothetical protein NTW95_00940 [Candidatus Aminicenantes bacterium]|nr:hypothetical protein [Candidatus Aminicenantes bacterium]